MSARSPSLSQAVPCVVLRTSHPGFRCFEDYMSALRPRAVTPILVISGAFVGAAAFAAEAPRPNVLVFYADDLGYGELAVQGFTKDIPTPNIDSIARNGVRFTQGYVAATYCSPSRAGLMTGRYPTRFGHEFNAVARHSGLSLQETTMAQRLKSLGYATAAIGKWHLGGEASRDYYPTSRGFEIRIYGTLNNTPFYHPTQFVDRRKSLDVENIDDKNFYTTDAYAARAVDWLGQPRGQTLVLVFAV